jgi:EAL domain-containing protein (putative c-di-GMP-specific phosphodiesterase class I)/FixJ family two-component response regulator
MPKRSMLILDDEAAVAQTIKWIAEGLGFEASFVTNPADFFRALDESCPEFITIDLVMPELDGVEVMRLLSERNFQSKIIISSGMGTRVLDAAQRSASEHGLSIAGVISKPISRESLRSLVAEDARPDLAKTTARQAATSNVSAITEQELRDAVDRHEFVMAYQPKIDCLGGAVAGFEALVRWNHPSRGVIMPDQFIPLAERTGMIDTLSAQIFDQSLGWFSKTIPEENILLSLNISARSLVEITMADSLASLCSQHHVAPQRIVLEVTETAAMVDPMLSLDLMTRLRVKGFQLSIDDFGTGFSSMVQLVRLPFSEIKVDRSFVMRANVSDESRTVIRSITDLGHSLGLLVAAEGVEDLKALSYLNSLGCDLAQGYFIARPMSGDAVRVWLEQRNKR